MEAGMPNLATEVAPPHLKYVPTVTIEGRDDLLMLANHVNGATPDRPLVAPRTPWQN